MATIQTVEDSPRFHLTEEDVVKWLTGVAYYSIPPLLILLTQLLGMLPEWLADKPQVLFLTTFIVQQLMGLLKAWYTKHQNVLE